MTLLFLGIHQIEGHIVVPNVMGSALRLHPLLVIFGLLAGGEIYGLPGILVALPLLAVLPRDLGVLRRPDRSSSPGAEDVRCGRRSTTDARRCSPCPTPRTTRAEARTLGP